MIVQCSPVYLEGIVEVIKSEETKLKIMVEERKHRCFSCDLLGRISFKCNLFTEEAQDVRSVTESSAGPKKETEEKVTENAESRRENRAIKQ